MKRTLHSDSKPFITVPVAQRSTNATVTGIAVDRDESKNYFRLAHVLIVVGEIANGTHEFAFEVSDDNVSWVSPDDQFLLGSVPGVLDSATDNAIHEFGYTGYERYLRVSLTVADVPALITGGTAGAVILMHGARRTPV